MIDTTAVGSLLEAFRPGPHAHDADSLAQTLALITDKTDPFDRTDYDPGHITASAIVLSPDGKSPPAARSKKKRESRCPARSRRHSCASTCMRFHLSRTSRGTCITI